ncbi:MAG: N-acetylmuramoyl-L-alanine amidase [Alphaproteobacteria bacterium]|nr:N-acetylmuramoyl-L-alanine amidase [Alphaproteobacteria bacterium]
MLVSSMLALVLDAANVHTALAKETPAAATPELVAYDMRVAGDEIRTRVVIEFEQKPEFSFHLLKSPHRMVVDLPETLFGLDEEISDGRGLLSDIRYGLMAPGRSRIVFKAIGPMKPEMAEIMENDSGGGYRLVFDLVAISDSEFAKLMREQDWSGQVPQTGKSARIAPVDPVAKSQFTVAIDPGHGGIDTGARGRKGLQEKDLTLEMSQTLKAVLSNYGDIRVIMTREDDRFVSLPERVRIARQHEADLFVSIHADSIRLRGVRGATVYTLSDKASDQMAQQLATSENRSDLIAGLSLEDEPDGVADILIDLTRRETHLFSVGMARSVVDSFEGSIKLIKNPIRSAGFRVLRAHDVPSVLVELGYLSNIEDEKLLRDPKWREKTAALLASAIDSFRRKTGGANN